MLNSYPHADLPAEVTPARADLRRAQLGHSPPEPQRRAPSAHCSHGCRGSPPAAWRPQPQRLPPFSGLAAAQLKAELRGRSLTCRPRPRHAFQPCPIPTPAGGRATPPSSLLPLPVRQRQGCRATPPRAPPRPSPNSPGETTPLGHAPPPRLAAPCSGQSLLGSRGARSAQGWSGPPSLPEETELGSG